MIWQTERILCFPIFSLIEKHIRFFVLEQAVSVVWQTRGTTVSGKHLIKFDHLPRGETPDGARWSRFSHKNQYIRGGRGRGPWP